MAETGGEGPRGHGTPNQSSESGQGNAPRRLRIEPNPQPTLRIEPNPPAGRLRIVTTAELMRHGIRAPETTNPQPQRRIRISPGGESRPLSSERETQAEEPIATSGRTETTQEQLTQRQNELERQLVDTRAELDALRQAYDELRIQQRQTLEHFADKERELARVRAQLEERTASLQLARNDIEVLMMQLTSAHNRERALRTENTRLRIAAEQQQPSSPIDAFFTAIGYTRDTLRQLRHKPTEERGLVVQRIRRAANTMWHTDGNNPTANQQALQEVNALLDAVDPRFDQFRQRRT